MDESGFLLHRPGAPEAINADSFDEDVLAADGPVLVEFWAARCAACRRLVPDLEALARERKVRVFTLDVDAELPAAERFGVRAIPAVLCFSGGREVGRRVGSVTARDLTALLDTL